MHLTIFVTEENIEKKEETENMAKTIIIGGVAGGATTATRLRRLDEQMEIVLLERGDYISYANCGLPYHLGGVIGEGKISFCRHRRT